MQIESVIRPLPIWQGVSPFEIENTFRIREPDARTKSAGRRGRCRARCRSRGRSRSARSAAAPMSAVESITGRVPGSRGRIVTFVRSRGDLELGARLVGPRREQDLVVVARRQVDADDDPARLRLAAEEAGRLVLGGDVDQIAARRRRDRERGEGQRRADRPAEPATGCAPEPCIEPRMSPSLRASARFASRDEAGIAVGRLRAVEAATKSFETRVLFRHIDEPGLHTIETYERLGGYTALKTRVPRPRARRSRQRVRGFRPARPRRRRLLDGQEGELPAARRHGQVPLLQRRRVRARHLQGPRADVQEPARARRGRRDRRDGGRRDPRVHLHPRRVRRDRRPPRRRRRRGLRRRLPRRRHPRHRGQRQHRRPPRRRRLHLRRGDGAARLARGQARQPAPEAAVPGDPGPLRRPDADQQRRDADEPPERRQQRRRLVQELRHRAVDRHQGRLRLRLRPAARATTRSSSASPPATSSTASPAARPRAARSRPGTRAAPPRPVLGPEELDLPYSFEALAEAGSMLGSGAIIVADDSRLDPGDGAADRALLPARVVRQVQPLPRGHELDREDARARRPRRGHPDGPRHHRLGPGQHHRPLPLRPRRRDGDAGRPRWSAAGARSSRRRSPAPARPARRRSTSSPP